MVDYASYKLVINSCGISDCTPDWSWITADTGFSDYDLWAVFRGNGELKSRGETFEVSAGSCMLLAPGEKYIGKQDPMSPLFVIHVHFCFLENEKAVAPFGIQHKHIADTAFFRDILNRVITYFYRNEAEKASFWLKAALFEFSSSKVASSIGSFRIGANEKCIFEMCGIINISAGNAPKLSDFAARYGYSETYLGKLFHKIIGITYTEYVTNARISKAKLFLRSSDDTISCIAEMLGYYDASFFSRQFKKHTGISPGEYRSGK